MCVHVIKTLSKVFGYVYERESLSEPMYVDLYDYVHTSMMFNGMRTDTFDHFCLMFLKVNPLINSYFHVTQTTSHTYMTLFAVCHTQFWDNNAATMAT